MPTSRKTLTTHTRMRAAFSSSASSAAAGSSFSATASVRLPLRSPPVPVRLAMTFSRMSSFSCASSCSAQCVSFGLQRSCGSPMASQAQRQGHVRADRGAVR